MGKGKKIDMQKALAPLALIILVIFFMIVSAGKGVSLSQYALNIFEAAYFVGFMALGVTYVIVTGGIDLSCGTVMMCAAMFGGVAYNVYGINLIVSLILVVLVGVVFGILNGFLVAVLKLPAFIATLGTTMISQGIGYIVSGSQTMRYPTVADADGWFKAVFVRTGSGFPVGIVWLIVFAFLADFILRKTKLGKYTMAIGSNAESVRLSGVNTQKWLWIVYIVDGFFCGMAGIFYAGTFTTIIPGSGSGQEMQAIAGIVIGGTSLAGGVGSIQGTMIGVFIMAVLKTGLMVIGAQQQWQLFFTGIVVILAVLVDIYRQKAVQKA